MTSPLEQASTTVDGRAVRDEAIQVATADLQCGSRFAPIVVSKDWGDCQVERFGDDEVEKARTRMHELLSGGAGSGHCAFAYLEGGRSIVIQVGRIGGESAEVFVQRFRPRRGRFRPFKLIGGPDRISEAPPEEARAPQGVAELAPSDG